MRVEILGKSFTETELVRILAKEGEYYLAFDRPNRELRVSEVRPLASFYIKVKRNGDRLLDYRNETIDLRLLIFRIRCYLREDLSTNVCPLSPSELEQRWNVLREREERSFSGYMGRKIYVPEDFWYSDYLGAYLRPDFVKNYLIESNFRWMRGLIVPESTTELLVFLSWVGERLREYGIKISTSSDEFGLKRISFRVYSMLEKDFVRSHRDWLEGLPYFCPWSVRNL